jgi:hypothetical protein
MDRQLLETFVWKITNIAVRCSMFWTVEGEKTGDGISYASHVKNPNPLKARATTFYDPVHNALDKEAQCAWKEGEGSYWPSVYIQKPFMTLYFSRAGTLI